MQDQYSRQSSFFVMIYEELIPTDHLLRKLSAAVDLDAGFGDELVNKLVDLVTNVFL